MNIRDEILILFKDEEMRSLYDEVFCFEDYGGEIDCVSTVDDFTDLLPLVTLAPVDFRVKRELVRTLIDECIGTSLEEYETLTERSSTWWDGFSKNAVGRVYLALWRLDYAYESAGPSEKDCFTCCELSYAVAEDGCMDYRITYHEPEFDTLDEALAYIKGQPPRDESTSPYRWFRIEKQYRGSSSLRWRNTDIVYFATGAGVVVGFDIPERSYRRSAGYFDYAYAWWRSIDPEANCIIPYKPGDIVEVDHAPFGPGQLCRLTLDDDEYWLGEARRQFGDEWVDRGLPDPHSDLSVITVSSRHSCERNATSIWLYTSPREPFVADVESTPQIMRTPFAINAVFSMRKAPVQA